MSILIKGMGMPKSCVYRENGHLMTCPLYDSDRYCKALNTETSHRENEKLSNCPLVPIQPHGRLIDADALIEALARMVPWAIADPTSNTFLDGLSAAYKAIQTAPTVIEAEGGE